MDKISTFEEILNNLVYKARENNNPVPDALIAFLLNIQYDKEKKDFYFKDNEKLSKEKAEEVIKKVQEILNAQRDGIVETFFLKFAFFHH